MLCVALPVALGVQHVANPTLLGLGGCSGSQTVSVAAAEESVEVLREVALSLEEGDAEADGRCVDYRVYAADPSEVSRSLDARAAGAPDLWVPDSAAWLERIDGFEGQPTVVSRSLARSPVVVAGRGLARPESWREVLSRDDVRFVDPVRSSAPAAALLALKAEPGSTGADVDSVMVPLAQRLGDDRDAPRDVTELALDPGGAVVLSEQQLLDLRTQGLGRDLDVRVPGTGTMVLDYPLVALTEGSVGVEAAEQLADQLGSPEGAELLEVAGFRSADLESLPRDRGAGQLDLLRAPGAEAVATTLRRWSVLTVPSRILGVFDVSGSMDEVAGGRTRVSLASEASAASMGNSPTSPRSGCGRSPSDSVARTGTTGSWSRSGGWTRESAVRASDRRSVVRWRSCPA